VTLLSADDGPRTAEAVPVVLARMEGKLDRVDDKIGSLLPRVDKLETRADALEVTTLTLIKNAEAEEAKKIALALALKEADETRRMQSEQSWTPAQRVMTILGSIFGAASLAIYYITTISH
jgi:hypothetical protein